MRVENTHNNAPGNNALSSHLGHQVVTHGLCDTVVKPCVMAAIKMQEGSMGRPVTTVSPSRQCNVPVGE